MPSTITLVNNANQSNTKVYVASSSVTVAELKTAAKNKLKLRATTFFAEGGKQLVDGDSLMPGSRVMCSAGEAYQGLVCHPPPEPAAAVAVVASDESPAAPGEFTSSGP
jgi:hypothetical protein